MKAFRMGQAWLGNLILDAYPTPLSGGRSFETLHLILRRSGVSTQDCSILPDLSPRGRKH